jgi:hypothetical protein
VDLDFVVLLGVHVPQLVELHRREEEPRRQPANPEWIALRVLVALEVSKAFQTADQYAFGRVVKLLGDPVGLKGQKMIGHKRNTQEEQCAISINGNYGLDLPALLAFAHLAFIDSDLAFLNVGEVYLLRFSLVTFAGAVLDGASPLFAAHLAF